MSEARVKTEAVIKTRIQLSIPALPNFIQTTEGKSIDIGNIPDSTLRKIGEMWTDKLIAHARKRKSILDA